MVPNEKCIEKWIQFYIITIIIRGAIIWRLSLLVILILSYNQYINLLNEV